VSSPAPRLTPPPTKGQTSVARVADDWYVVGRSRDLRRRPRAARLLGQPLVLFRDGAGEPAALLDRCPHRNVPLSLGRVADGELECRYHGWRFDGRGTCRRVPGLCDGDEAAARGRAAPAYPTREQDGFVWVYATPDVEPAREPYRFPYLDAPGYTTVRQVVEAEGSLHAVAENALDVPHTAFLHQGLFRGTGTTNRVEVVVRRWHDRVEAEYVGEPRPEGLAAWLLAPGGGEVRHHDRFFLPGVAQVEYRLGERSHFCVTTALTPLEDFRTRLFAVISFKLGWIPGWLVTPFLKPIGKKIFAQDAVMLAHQTAQVRRFGGEQFTSTEVDALGPAILRLLRSAERGDREPLVEPFEKRFAMEV